MANNVLQQLEQRLPAFSRGKKSIAQFILQSPHQAAFMTAAAMGKLVKVSESTVVRFASDLGYNGYPDMQKALQDVLMDQLSQGQDTAPRATQDSPKESLWTEEFTAFQEAIQGIPQELLSKAAELLLHSPRVYVVAEGREGCLGLYFSQGLSSYLPDVRNLSSLDRESLLRTLVDIRPGDSLVYICRGNDSLSHPAFRIARGEGAKTLLICDSPLIGEGEASLTLSLPMTDSQATASFSGAMGALHILLSLIKQGKTEEEQYRERKFSEMWEKYYDKNS